MGYRWKNVSSQFWVAESKKRWNHLEKWESPECISHTKFPKKLSCGNYKYVTLFNRCCRLLDIDSIFKVGSISTFFS